jgi:hypothetical protein
MTDEKPQEIEWKVIKLPTVMPPERKAQVKRRPSNPRGGRKTVEGAQGRKRRDKHL